MHNLLDAQSKKLKNSKLSFDD